MTGKRFALFEAPDLAPILLREQTREGWRGLTADGELYNVTARDGVVPARLCVSDRDGRPLGYRAVPPRDTEVGAIADYLFHFDRARNFMFANEQAAALAEIDQALDLAATTRAHFNRAMILLGLGRWREGLDAYARCERTPSFMRPNYRDALDHGIKPWQGEDLAGKHLLLVHDHGFGDTIMMLRFVPTVEAMGARVTLVLPPDLKRLAEQSAPVTDELVEADYFCSLLLSLDVLKIAPDQIPLEPYLKVDPALVEKWRGLVNGERKTIGIAWSVGVKYDGDYPRTIPLDELLAALDPDAELYSVQTQPPPETWTTRINAVEFENFADCAALMSVLDEIVTVDTAALHLAGAIGHPRITALLSHWASWRWLSPWYRNIRFCRQQSAGDWQS